MPGVKIGLTLAANKHLVPTLIVGTRCWGNLFNYQILAI
jgi:hypothetical protein